MKLKLLMGQLCLVLLILGGVAACTPTETEAPVEPPAEEVAAADSEEAILAGEQALEPALAETQSQAEQALVEAPAEPLDTEAEPLVVATPVLEAESRVIKFVPYWGDDSYRELAKSFNKDHPDITVNIHDPVFKDAPNIASLAEVSDCFGWFGVNSKDRRYVLNLDSFLETTPDFPLDDIYPRLLEPFRQRNSLWGIPQGTWMNVMYYNKDIFDAAGMAYPQTGWTLDDFLNTAQILTQGKGDDKQYGYLPTPFVPVDVVTFMALMDVTWVNTQADSVEFKFDDPALPEALQWYLDLTLTHQVVPIFEKEDPADPGTFALEQHQNLMRQGQAAMWLEPIQPGPLSHTPDDLNTGLVHLPLGKTEIIPADLTDGYFIAKDTPHPEACWRWITYLTEHNTEVVDRLPVRRSVAESAEFRANVGEELMDAYLFSIERTKVENIRFDGRFSPGYIWLNQAYEQALTGTPLETALNQIQEKAEAYTACLEDQAGFADQKILESCAKQVDPDLSRWYRN